MPHPSQPSSNVYEIDFSELLIEHTSIDLNKNNIWEMLTYCYDKDSAPNITPCKALRENKGQGLFLFFEPCVSPSILQNFCKQIEPLLLESYNVKYCEILKR